MSGTRPGLGLWAAGCGAAELLGIALAALWWVLIDRNFPAPETLAGKWAMVVAKGLAGLLEGAVLGVVQAGLLRLRYPALSVGGWTRVTMGLAMLGWMLGSAPSILLVPDMDPQGVPSDPPPGITALYAAGFGLVVGAAFGAAQWLVLRRAARRALLWIPANMIGWAVALPLIYLAASVGSAELGVGAIAVRAVLGGLGAGLLFGLVTGLFLRRIPPPVTAPV